MALGNNVINLHVGGDILENAEEAVALGALSAAGVAAELRLGVVLAAEFAEVARQQDRLGQLERQGKIIRRHDPFPFFEVNNSSPGSDDVTQLRNNVVDLYVDGHVLENAVVAAGLAVLRAPGVAAELRLGVVLTAELLVEAAYQQDRLGQLERQGQIVRRHGRSPVPLMGRSGPGSDDVTQ